MSKEHHIDKKRGHIKKKASKRRKSGEKALKEITYYQEKPGLLVPVTTVRRGVKHALKGARITQVAFDKIHVALEDHMVRVFRSAQMMAIHAKRVTIMPRDLTALFKVCHSMEGREDLDEESPNPIMRRKKKKASTKNPPQPDKEKKKRKRHKKLKERVIEQPQAIVEIEVEQERIHTIFNYPVVEEQEQEEQPEEEDWCLEEY